MENFIVVLLIIIYVIFSIKKNLDANKKKAKAAKPYQPASQQEGSTKEDVLRRKPIPEMTIPKKQKTPFEELMEAFGGVLSPEPPVVKTKPAEVTIPKKVEKKRREFEYQPLSARSLETIMSETDPENTFRSTQDITELSNDQIKDFDKKTLVNFNLRDAVIFSELLNPKYF